MLPFDKGYAHFRNDENIPHFHIACARNNVDIVKKYLQSGQNINCVKWDGYTSLHFAVKFKST